MSQIAWAVCFLLICYEITELLRPRCLATAKFYTIILYWPKLMVHPFSMPLSAFTEDQIDCL